MKKKFLSVLLCLCLMAGANPISASAAESYLWPVPAGKNLSRGYSSWHTALDITSGGHGADILSTKSGTVVIAYTGCGNYSAWGTGVSCSSSTCACNNMWYDSGESRMSFCNWGYGNGVIIQHSDGSGYSMYAHMSSVNVSTGAYVNRGDVIGKMGSAGKSTGPHLHFELSTNVSKRGTYYDPSNYSIDNSTGAINYVDRLTPSVTFSPWSKDGYTYTRETDASIGQLISVSNGNCTETGMYLYDASGRQVASAKNDSYSPNVPQVYFQINGECRYTLTPGTTYKYKFYAVVNGKTYWSDEGSFKTSGASIQTTIYNLGSDFYATIYYPNGGKLVRANGGDGSTYTNVEIAGGEYASVDSTDPKCIWHFVRDDSSGAYKIINEFYGWCLDVAGGLAGQEINVATWHDDHGGNPERWYITNAPGSDEKWYNLVTALEYPTYTMDVTGGATSSGTNVQLWTRSIENVAQQFNIVMQTSYSRPPTPAKPANVKITADPSGTSITWNAVPAYNSYDKRAYRVRVFSDKDSANPVIDSIVYSNKYASDTVLPAGSYTAQICAVNTNYSASSSNYISGFDMVGFSTINISLSVSSAGGGTVFGGGTYLKGGRATLRAIPDNGYRFVKWVYEDGTLFSEDETIVSLVVNQSEHWIAVFEPNEPSITKRVAVNVSAAPPAGGTVTGGGNYANGATVKVNATANSGYMFKGWTENGKAVSSDSVYSFNASADRYLVAVFEKVSLMTRFIDVPADAFFAAPVDWAVEQGITGGTSPTTFSPGKTCTRAQIMTFLWHAAGDPEPETTVNPFKDVKPDDYFYKPVLWAVENGITGGTSATTFSPNRSCTREQAMTFIWVAANRPVSVSNSNPFTDVGSDVYYYDAVLWAVGKGVTGGTTPTTFSPNRPCTRGQIVTFLYNWKTT